MVTFRYLKPPTKYEIIRKIATDHMKAEDDFYTRVYNWNAHHIIFAGARQNHTFQNLNDIYGVMIEKR